VCGAGGPLPDIRFGERAGQSFVVDVEPLPAVGLYRFADEDELLPGPLGIRQESNGEAAGFGLPRYRLVPAAEVSWPPWCAVSTPWGRPHQRLGVVKLPLVVQEVSLRLAEAMGCDECLANKAIELLDGGEHTGARHVSKSHAQSLRRDSKLIVARYTAGTGVRMGHLAMRLEDGRPLNGHIRLLTLPSH
jgi:hypothetical protein